MSAVQSYKMDEDMCSPQLQHFPCAAFLHKQESHLPEDDAQKDSPVSPEVTSRALLIHSPVQMRRGWRRRKRHLFLFSDVLLVSNTKYKKSFKMKDMIPLHILSMAECGDKVESGGGRSKKSFVLSWPGEKFKVTFRSSELKERWYSLLQRYINIHKEKELQNIALQTCANDFQKGGTQGRHLPQEETHLERPVTPENDGRALLIHSPVQMQMRSRRKKQHLFLFTDLLLVSNTKYKKRFKMKYVVPLRSLWMAECGDNEKGGDHSRKSLMLGWPMQNVKATFGSSEQKEKWCSFLQRYIGLAKEDADNSIPLQIFTTEVKNTALPITVIARHSDTVNDVIRKSLSSLKITGSENEYQLWIDSGKREESIALLGHENPYVIKMSQLGVTEFLPRGPSTHEMHNLHSPVLEHWNPPVGFRFVLKPRQPANGKQPNNSEQKREGRGRAFLNWLFGRQSNIAKENLPGKSASPKAGLLFGVSLQAACQDGKLPSAVLDMISFLSQEGELTEGIFRKSGGVKAYRALKEKLISGAPVDLRQESVFVVASVLKDFLRNVEGGVFSTPQYETWLGIMGEDKDEEKITAAQSLLEMLPKANRLLLKHLFAMLNHIQKNSSLNLMTSYNLAVCTATSLMAPPPDARAGFDLELMRKVALVQFLIENTPQIFTKDFPPLWEESSGSDNDTAAE
ncbi:rho GTPase-activating protein 20-like isoform 1-T1 [Thomomys bottae]